ncbi:MAG TPA: hypothetical protein VIX19_13830 [Terriglobales bacterium]
MKKFVSWLGGIAATVIAGWLVYRVTLPPAPPPPPPPEIAFEGMVIDGDRNIPVKSALVSFEVDGVSAADAYHDLTDENGSYGVKLSGLSKTSNVVLLVQAHGYTDQSKQFTSLIDDNRYDPIMTALPTPAPPTPPRGVALAPARSPTIEVRMRPQYIQKKSIQTFKIEPVQKK